MRKSFLVRARALVCACEGLPSACENAPFCIRIRFLVKARGFLSACEKPSLCKREASFCMRESHAHVEGNCARFAKRRSRVITAGNKGIRLANSHQIFLDTR